MKCAALENRSTTTRITLFPVEVGRPVMKSMETLDHGRAGMRPAGRWLLDLCCAQTGHTFMKVLTSPRILGHQNLLRINSKVRCTPAWPVRRVEWPHCKTCDLVELGTKRQPSGASGGQVSDSRAWRTVSSMVNCTGATMQEAGRMGSRVRSLSERSNWRERASAFVFFDPGLYESTKLKWLKNSAHFACRGFSRLASWI